MGGVFANVPTWREEGLAVLLSNWRGTAGPKAMPPAQIAYWNGIFHKTTQLPAWQQQLARGQLTSRHYLDSTAIPQTARDKAGPRSRGAGLRSLSIATGLRISHDLGMRRQSGRRRSCSAVRLAGPASPYPANETRDPAAALNLVPCFTPALSPKSNGMSEAFVKIVSEFTHIAVRLSQHESRQSGRCQDMEGNRSLPHVLPVARCGRNMLAHPGSTAGKVAKFVVALAKPSR